MDLRPCLTILAVYVVLAIFNCFCSSLQKSASDYNNFDREFLSEKPRLSHSDKNLIDSMDQSAFAGFSFINPKFEQILEK